MKSIRDAQQAESATPIPPEIDQILSQAMAQQGVSSEQAPTESASPEEATKPQQ